MEAINTIKQSPVYQQIMKDSFGGIMYDVSNGGKYDTTELTQAWDALTPAEQEMAGGIMTGVFNFLKEYEA